MKKILAQSKLWQITGLIVADLLFFGTTNPANVPSYMLVVGFLLFTATFYYFVLGILRLGKWYGLGFSKKQVRMARIITAVVAGIVALQSTGQLSSREIYVLIPLAMIAYVYMSYVRPTRDVATVKE